MARTEFYSSDANLKRHEPFVEQLFPSTPRVDTTWTSWDVFRIWVTDQINVMIKKLGEGNMWYVLESLGYLNGEGTDNEIVDLTVMLNPEDLETLEDYWVLEKIYEFRYPDLGDALKQKAAYSKYKDYQSRRQTAQNKLRLMFDEDVDGIIEREYFSDENRIERG